MPALPIISTQTTGGVWTDIAVGAAAITKVTANNVGTADAQVSLRLLRGSDSIMIIPADNLPLGKGFEPRLPALPLQGSTHKLQAMSNVPVDWAVASSTLVSAKQATRFVRTSGDTWTTVWNESAGGSGGTVTALLAANTSIGDSIVSARILRSGGNTVIISPEAIAEGGSRRKTPVAVLAAAESIQVKSQGGVDWIVCGVAP